MIRSWKTCRGATLIELVTAIVIVSLAIAGVLLLTTDTTRRSGDPLLIEQANSIAGAYMEEIQQKQFCDPDFDVDSDPMTPLNCPLDCSSSLCNAGGCRNNALGSIKEAQRSVYDDICDYDNLSDSGARDQNDNPVTGLNQYTINVNITDDNGATIGTAGNTLTGTSGEVVLITITVSHPAMQSDVIVSAYRSNL